MKNIKIVGCLMWLFSFSVWAEQKVFVKDGNIYTSIGTIETQLTSSRRDSMPVLSPNGEMIAFVRGTNLKLPASCVSEGSLSESEVAQQLWLYHLSSKEEIKLVDPNLACNDSHPNYEKNISQIKNIMFFPGSKKIYFTTLAWWRSDAVHVVNVDGKNQHFVVPGTLTKITTSGAYEDHLIVYHHRYYIDGGSYDGEWLHDPEGREAGALNPDSPDPEMSKFFLGN